MTIRAKIIWYASGALILTLSLFMHIVSDFIEDYHTSVIMEKNIALMVQVARLTTMVQRERGLSSVFASAKTIKENILEKRRGSDQALREFYPMLDDSKIPETEKNYTRTELARLDSLREEVLNGLLAPELLKRYTTIIESVLKLNKACVSAKTNFGFDKVMAGLSNIMQAQEASALLQGTISGLLAADKAFPLPTLENLLRLNSRLESSLNATKGLLSKKSAEELDILLKSPQAEEFRATVSLMIQRFSLGEFNKEPNLFFKTATVLVDGFVKISEQEAEFKVAQIAKIREEKLNIAVIAGLIGLIIILFGLFYTKKLLDSILSPVQGMAKALENIANGEGDLTKRLEKSGDETGEMAHWFNRFTDDIAKMVKEVHKVVGEVETLTTQFESVSETLQKNASEVSEKTHTAAAATEEMSVNSTETARFMSQSSETLGSVATTTHQMTQTINEIASTTEQARTTARSAVDSLKTVGDRIHELSEAAAQIGGVTDTIRDISEQTNLLALNATIEAARAGESGKGFAVVASEIKELAHQTSTATANIHKKIETIQKVTTTTATTMNEISSVIRSIHDSVNTIAVAIEEQFAVTIDISENITKANIQVQESSNLATQNSLTTQEIARETGGMNRISTDVQEESEKIHFLTRDLGKLSQTLLNLVRKFKV